MANIDAVSFGPYTVKSPPLKSIIASKIETESCSKQLHRQINIHRKSQGKPITLPPVFSLDNPKYIRYSTTGYSEDIGVWCIDDG